MIEKTNTNYFSHLKARISLPILLIVTWWEGEERNMVDLAAGHDLSNQLAFVDMLYILPNFSLREVIKWIYVLYYKGWTIILYQKIHWS